MLKEEILDKIDNADKKEMENMVNSREWKNILKTKELMEYYKVSLKLKQSLPSIELWEKFQNRLVEKRKQKKSFLKNWMAIGSVAVLILIAGIIYLPQNKTKEYIYTELPEKTKVSELVEQNEKLLMEYKKQDDSVLDYYYEIATL